MDAANTATVTTLDPHGLIENDIVAISGATVDTELNANYAVLAGPTETTLTVTTSGVTDTTYTEATLRIRKLNQPSVGLMRGPAVIDKSGLNWGDSDSTGVTAGLADLALLGIVAREGI